MIDRIAIVKDRYLILASKPSDVLNALDYLCFRGVSIDESECIVLGEQDRQAKTIIFCNKAGIRYRVEKRPDLYSVLLFSLKKYTLPSFLQIPLKVILRILSIPYYFYAAFIYSRKKYASKTLITDIGKSKLFVSAFIDFESLIITDGGMSTKTWGLVDNWLSQPSDVAIINSSLKQKASNIPLVFIRRLKQKLHLCREKVLFTKYIDSSACTPSIIQNNSCYSRGAHFSILDRVAIIGYPNMEYFQEQVVAALPYIEKKGANCRLTYYVHPSDVNVFQGLIRRSERIRVLINRHNIEVRVSHINFDLDALLALEIPRVIIVYKSSLLSWLDDLNISNPDVVVHRLNF